MYAYNHWIDFSRFIEDTCLLQMCVYINYVYTESLLIYPSAEMAINLSTGDRNRLWPSGKRV